MAVDQASGAGYTSSTAHLADELHRAHGLVRAQLLRFKLSAPEPQRERFWHLPDDYLEQQAEREQSPLASYAGDREVQSVLEWVDQRREAIDRRIGATRGTVLRLVELQRRFRLDGPEVDLLLLALLPLLHSRYRRLYGVLQLDAARVLPTAGFLAEALARDPDMYGNELQALGRGGGLVDSRLVSLLGSEDDPLPLRPVAVEDRVNSYLMEDDRPDSRLAERGSWCSDVPDLRTLPIARDILTRLEMLPNLRAAEPDFLPRLRLQFSGPDSSLAVRAFASIMRELHRSLFTADVAAMLQSPVAFATLVDVALREARLVGGGLLFSNAGSLLSKERPEHLRHVLHRMQTFPQPAAVELGTAVGPDGLVGAGAFIPFYLAPPTVDMRQKLWLGLLAEDGKRLGDTNELARELALAFQLTDSQVREAHAGARILARRRNVFIAPIERADLFAACRGISSRQLVAFAERIEPDPELKLEHLVLPALNVRHLKELQQRVKNHADIHLIMRVGHSTRRGTGVLALFVGASGTGKTMAAEALASAQKVDLYRVDLAAVVSKWVGEMEKNLAQIFADAERTNCMLFFDEADAIFGRRGEIKEAHDRWANLEVNYLLQAVERHKGVVILATNFRQNIDEAFQRRIHVIVEFPMPDAASRREIWARLLPSGDRHSVPDAALTELADRFELSGGNIRNVVVDACYRAMGTPDRRLTTQHLVAGLVREYQKVVRPVTLGEFGQPFYDYAMAVLMPEAEPAAAGGQ
jgi:hypothetical protein